PHLWQRQAERLLDLRQQKVKDDEVVEVEAVAENRRRGNELALSRRIGVFGRRGHRRRGTLSSHFTHIYRSSRFSWSARWFRCVDFVQPAVQCFRQGFFVAYKGVPVEARRQRTWECHALERPDKR